MSPLGYKILVEVIGRGRVRSIAEVGYVFRERTEGASKVTWRVYLDYLRHLARLRLSALSSARFLRFALVGASGVVVDMAFLFLFSDPRALGLGLTRSKALAAELAIINNFLWNDAWTFRDLVGGQTGLRHKLRRLLKFNLVCGFGLLLNVALLNIQFNVLHMNRYVANLVAIAVVTAWNYWLNLRLNWRGYRLQYWMPRSTSSGENTLLTSMKQPLSRTIAIRFVWPIWTYSLWLTATISPSRFL
jgi:dolichol-phosphate mannosyltransferase